MKLKWKTASHLKRYLTVILFSIALNTLSAQSIDSISLDQCYQLAKNNYPLIKQSGLIEKTSGFTVENISKGYLPQISFNGQATYQSDVTTIPIPNITAPSVSKDQYKVYTEISQTIIDGGLIKQQQEQVKAAQAAQQQNLEVELYQLKNRVNDLYFGIMLIDAQIEQTNLLKKDIQTGIDNTNAAIANGTALQSSADLFKAALLKTDQQAIELSANRKAFAGMLSYFIGKPFDENTKLQVPSPIAISAVLQRPELKWFDAQKKSFSIQDKLITARNMPRLALFLQGGFGRPALNLLNNNFTSYYIGGIKLNWNFGGLYTAKNDRALLQLNQQAIDVQKNIFVFNTNLALLQQNTQVEKFQKLIVTDNQIVTLRKSIKQTAMAQLQFGTITANDYLSYVNAENQAAQNLLLHQLQLLQAQYNYQTTSGNE